MRRFGSDKPDLRFGLELADVNAAFAGTEFVVFKSVIDAGGAIVALRYPGGGALSRRDFDALTETAKQFDAKGMVWIALASRRREVVGGKVLERGKYRGGSSRNRSGTTATRFCSSPTRGNARMPSPAKCATPSAIAAGCAIPKSSRSAGCWASRIWRSTRRPGGRCRPIIRSPRRPTASGNSSRRDPMKMRAQHYDMVLNGWELGSGSIRIHNPEKQRKIFEMLGLTAEQIEDRFGFFVRALEYGAPPHGGMALGIDRIVMIACGEVDLREVIAFPKNQAARDLMMDAPSPVPENLLRDLYLKSTFPGPNAGR